MWHPDYMTAAEYIAFMEERVYFWAKAFAEANGELRREFCVALSNAEEQLSRSGIDWDDIDKIVEKAFTDAESCSIQTASHSI